MLENSIDEKTIIITIDSNDLLIASVERQYSIKTFFEFLIKKAPFCNLPEIVSPKVASFIIDSIIRDVFKKNLALINLTKTKSFSKDLYEFFGDFLKHDISPEQLLNILSKIKISEEDYNRFLLIIDVYGLYLEKLRKINFIDARMQHVFIQKIFKENPNYLEFIKNNISKILLDSSVDLLEEEIELLKCISDVEIVDFVIDRQNNVSRVIEDKYLKKENRNNIKNELKDFRLIKFSDLKSEVNFIAKEIIKAVKNDNLKFSDFAVVIGNPLYKKAVQDIFTSLNIEIDTKLISEDFELFKIKLIQYFTICNCLQKLSQISIKSEREFVFEELNFVFENIISTILDDKFVKEKFSLILNNSSEESLISCVKNNMFLLSNEQANNVKAEIEKIEKINELYNEGKITEICVFLSPFRTANDIFQSCLSQFINRVNSLEQLNKKLSKKIINYSEIINLLENFQPEIRQQKKDCVKLLSLKNNEKNVVKKVYIIGISEDSFLSNSKKIEFVSKKAQKNFYEELKQINKQINKINDNEEKEFYNSIENFAKIVSLAEDSLVISMHEYEGKKQINLSRLFSFLISVFEENYMESNYEVEKETNQKLHYCEKIKPFSVVISSDDKINLSASSISNFQRCPRKFYFANLLGLSQTSTFAANYGTIVHSIMENFNSNYLQNYSAKTLLELCDILFNSINNPQEAINLGFKEKDIKLVTSTDVLSLADMKEIFESAVGELEKVGFFNVVPEEIICEKSFSFELEFIPNVVFNGRIDAIYKYNNGYKIVDFKTGKTYGKLDYYISDSGVEFKTKTGREGNVEKIANEYAYQIPIYYLATLNSQDLVEYKGKVKEFELLYMRAKDRDGGLLQDVVSAEKLDMYSSAIIKNLKETIIDKIRNVEYFEPRYSDFICANCDFKFLCEMKDEELNEG